MRNLSVLSDEQLANEAKECGQWIRVRARELEYFLLHLPPAQAAADPAKWLNLRNVFRAYIENLEEQLARVRALYEEWSRRYMADDLSRGDGRARG